MTSIYIPIYIYNTYIYIYIYIYNTKRIYICEFKKCKISDPHMLVLNLADKIDLKILY